MAGSISATLPPTRCINSTAAGKVLLTYGRLDVQKPETYDPLTLMSPGKLATWTDH